MATGGCTLKNIEAALTRLVKCYKKGRKEGEEEGDKSMKGIWERYGEWMNMVIH